MKPAAHAAAAGLVARVLEQLGQGQAAAALELAERALALAPRLPVVHFALARAAIAVGRHEQAVAACRRAIALGADTPDAHQELGIALRRSGRDDEAIECCRAALRRWPGSAGLQVNLGNLLQARGDADATQAAEAAFAAALAAAPRLVPALVGLALMLEARGQQSQARSLTRRAVAELDAAGGPPGAAALRLHAALGLQVGDTAAAIRALRDAVAHEPEHLPTRALYAASLQLHAQEPGAAAMLALGRQQLAPLKLEQARAPHRNRPLPDRRLRVGYLSPDFRAHSCASFLLPLLAAHDAADFEVCAYSTTLREDATTAAFRAAVPHWHAVAGLNDAELAARIEADGIDLLVDAAGLTEGHRLRTLGLKPAPVQLGWLGFLGSTGLDTMDGRVTDTWVDPVASAGPDGGEPALRLPRCYVCYAPAADAPEPAPPPLLQRGFPTFGSFNNLSKLGDSTLRLWAGALQAVPDARLLIKARLLADAEVRVLLSARLQGAGIDPGRVQLLDWSAAPHEHLALYAEVDVALDSFPYHGVTTTCEASWMGVPVVSLVGPTPASRQGLTLLTALGTPEQAVATPEAFAQCCRALLARPDELARRRAGLRARMAASPLTDAKGLAAALQALYRERWRLWCREAQPGGGGPAAPAAATASTAPAASTASTAPAGPASAA